MPSSIGERVRRSIADAESRLADRDALAETLLRLENDGSIDGPTASDLGAALPDQIEASRYILRNLGAHFAIGVIFAFDVVPLPLGTVARVSWVAGNRVLETTRRNRARARVHSAGVLVVAAIPWFGYGAYLLPLRRDSADLAFVLANHSWLTRTGRTYEQFLSEARYPIRRLGRWLIPPPESRTEPSLPSD